VVSYAFDDNNVFFGLIMEENGVFFPGISNTAFDTVGGVNSGQNIESIIGKLDENGQLLWSTYLGGTGLDVIYNISVADGIVAAGGFTNSSDFPLHQANYTSLTNSDEYFISTFDYDGNIIYSSYLNNPGATIDLSNRIITSNGYTSLVATINETFVYPITQNPSPPLINERKIAVIVLDPNNNLHYSTLYNNEETQFLDE